jgi:hypothetical protein
LGKARRQGADMQLHVNQSIFGPDGDPLDYPSTRPDDA